jgi:ATP-dependent Lon protease
MEDIPEDVRSQLKFHCVATLEEVFAVALVPLAAMPAASPTLMEEEAAKVA